MLSWCQSTYSQNYGFIDTLEANEVSYVFIDSNLLKGDNYVIYVRVTRSMKEIVKFDLDVNANTVRIIKGRDSLVYNNEIDLLRTFNSINIEKSLILNIYPDNYSGHEFDYLLVRRHSHNLQLIPVGSTINKNFKVLEEYSLPLSELSNLILQLVDS